MSILSRFPTQHGAAREFLNSLLPVVAALLGLLLLNTTARASDQLSAPQLTRAVGQCIDKQFQAGEATTRGKLVTLHKTCPTLARARNHPLLKHIQPPLTDEITVSQLLDIRSLLASRTRAASSVKHKEYAYAGLDALLEETYVPAAEFKPQLTWWQRFAKWLRELLTPEDQETPAWLESFLDSIELPETDTVVLFLKGAVALLVLLTLVMIFNELRAANLLSAWRHIKQQRHSSPDDDLIPAGSNQLNLSHITRLPDKQFASKLLYFTLINLMHRHFLPQRFTLTNRELLSQVPQEESELLAELHQLIEYTDAGLYGDRHYAPQQRQHMMQLSNKLTTAAREVS